MSRIRQIADEQAARELDLFLENESSLYPQKQAILTNLQKKADKGQYDASKAPKLWQYWVDAGARQYGKEYGGKFDAATRRHLATELARRYENPFGDDEGIRLPPGSRAG